MDASTDRRLTNLEYAVADMQRENNKRPVQFAAQGGGDPLPTPTALYQVVSVTVFPGDGTYTWGADWIRAHS